MSEYRGINTLQLERGHGSNDEILRLFYRRLRDGWYTVRYRGESLDRYTAVSVRRNKGGKLIEVGVATGER